MCGKLGKKLKELFFGKGDPENSPIIMEKEDCGAMRTAVQDLFSDLEDKIRITDDRRRDLRTMIRKIDDQFAQTNSTNPDTIPFMVAMYRYLQDMITDMEKDSCAAADVRARALKEMVIKYNDFARQTNSANILSANNDRVNRILQVAMARNKNMAPAVQAAQLDALVLYSPEQLYYILLYDNQREYDLCNEELDQLQSYDELSIADRNRRDNLRAKREQLKQRINVLGNESKRQIVIQQIDALNKEVEATRRDTNYAPYSENDIADILQKRAELFNTGSGKGYGKMGGDDWNTTTMPIDSDPLSDVDDLLTTSGSAPSEKREASLDDLKDILRDMRRYQTKLSEGVKKRAAEWKGVGRKLLQKIGDYKSASPVDQIEMEDDLDALKYSYNTLDATLKIWRQSSKKNRTDMGIIERAIAEKERDEGASDFVLDSQKYDILDIARRAKKDVEKGNAEFDKSNNALTLLSSVEIDVGDVVPLGGVPVAKNDSNTSNLDEWEEELKKQGFED